MRLWSLEVADPEAGGNTTAVGAVNGVGVGCDDCDDGMVGISVGAAEDVKLQARLDMIKTVSTASRRG